MENNGKVEPARYYAVTKMLKLIGSVKSYEDEEISEKQKTKEGKQKGLNRMLYEKLKNEFSAWLTKKNLNPIWTQIKHLLNDI